MEKHLLCVRCLLVCLHTPHNKAYRDRNCCHSFSDGETEAHKDEDTCPRSLSEWYSQDLGTCAITHVLRFSGAENMSSASV